jgi:hypothetical protein
MLLGNFEEVYPWDRQTTVGPGQISAAECVVFMKDVSVGEPVEMDYDDQVWSVHNRTYGISSHIFGDYSVTDVVM